MPGSIKRLLDRLRGRSAEPQPAEAPEPAEMPSEAPRPQHETDVEEMRTERLEEGLEQLGKPPESPDEDV
jgi:hypothetical protein